MISSQLIPALSRSSQIIQEIMANQSSNNNIILDNKFANKMPIIETLTLSTLIVVFRCVSFQSGETHAIYKEIQVNQIVDDFICPRKIFVGMLP